MPNPEDQALVQSALKGEETAYAALIRKYQAKIIQLCTAMLSDYKEAEDAAQDVFVKAYGALSRFQGKSSFYTWLHRIASNHCLDLLRKRSRHPTQSWEELVEDKGDEIEKLISTQVPREANESREIVHLVLGQLSADYRLILTLREIQGLTYQEMAESLNSTIDSIKGRLKRARLEFKEKLQPFLGRENV